MVAEAKAEQESADKAAKETELETGAWSEMAGPTRRSVLSEAVADFL